MADRPQAGASDPIAQGRSWDVFCKVVDNYGDIGVCWRLARQLISEHAALVRLWVDDLTALARLQPGIDRKAEHQQCRGVDVRHWAAATPFDAIGPADIVVEAFGCDPPPAFVEAMARRPRQPAWFNLEYLSAEAWIETHHLLPSPHPRLPLVKHFYFPGFTPATGGLLREAGLLDARDAFVADSAALERWLASIDVPVVADEIRVSMFGYANPRAAALLERWARGSKAIRCIVPDGVLTAEIAAFAGRELRTGEAISQGNLVVQRIPFVDQGTYDLLLWAMDVNFVRGEDSFVRAQWAGRPMVWHVYPQDDDAHRMKLAAFVRRYIDRWPARVASSLSALFDAWNGFGGDVALAWDSIEPQLAPWREATRQWAAQLSEQRDLARKLAESAENQL